MGDSKVELVYIGDKCFIFDYDTFMKLFKEYHLFTETIKIVKQKDDNASFLPTIIDRKHLDMVLSRHSIQNINISINSLTSKFDDVSIQNYLKPIDIFLKNTKFYTSNGLKFGCDLLLYSSPPPFCHADYCVSFYEYDKPINAIELISKVRVCRSTKKRTVISTIDHSGSILSFIIDWTKNLEESKI